MLEDNVDEKYYISSKHIEFKNLKEQLCDKIIEENKIQESDVIRHSYSTNRMENLRMQNANNNNISPTLDTRCDCLGIAVKNNTKQGYLIANDGDGVDISSRMKYHRGNVQKETIQTIDCTGGEGHGVVMPDLRIRKLTPKECWRLMGFDDESFEKAQAHNSNAQLYKQAGNSIVVNVLMAIFEKLLKKEDK